MSIIAWDEPAGFVDVADDADDSVQIMIAEDDGEFLWSVWTRWVTGWDHDTHSPAWEQDVLAEGTAATEADAERLAEDAKESHLRSLIRR